MWWLKLTVAGIISLLFLFFIWKQNRKKAIVIQENSIGNEKNEKSKSKEYISIHVERTSKGQINIRCKNLDGEPVGELLAIAYYKETDCGEYQGRNAVHLEQLLVRRKYRRRGIGKVMFYYLLEEMQKIEEMKKEEFQFIYGEIGEGGTDDPRISLPYYRKMEKCKYGDKGELHFQHTRKNNSEEYDKFIYYINRG